MERMVGMMKFLRAIFNVLVRLKKKLLLLFLFIVVSGIEFILGEWKSKVFGGSGKARFLVGHKLSLIRVEMLLYLYP